MCRLPMSLEVGLSTCGRKQGAIISEAVTVTPSDIPLLCVVRSPGIKASHSWFEETTTCAWSAVSQCVQVRAPLGGDGHGGLGWRSS